MNITEKDRKRFWDKVDIRGKDECWEWQASCWSGGYGQFGLQGKMQSSHRVSWLITNGDIGSLCVLHHCDNRKCCNPKHLSLGTQQDNIKDRDEKRRQAIGAQHGRAKLSELDVLEIRKLKKTMTLQSLAELYRVSPNQIWNIVNRKSWRHI